MRSTTPLTTATTAAALLIAAGCATHDQPLPLDNTNPPRAFAEPDPYDINERPVTEIIPHRRADRSNRDNRRLDDRTLSAAPRQPTRNSIIQRNSNDPTAGELFRVNLTLRDTPAADVARTIVSQYMRADFIIDDDLPGRLTLDIDDRMTAADAATLLDTLAAIYGWSVERRAGAVVVQPLTANSFRSPDTPILRTAPAFPGASTAIRVRRLDYLDPNNLVSQAGNRNNAGVLSSVLSNNAIIAAAGNLLVIADTTAQLEKATALLDAIDVPAFDGVRIATFRIDHSTPDAAEQILTSLAQGTKLAGGTGTDPLVSFVPVPDSDRLIVIARDPSVMDQAELLIDQIDRPASDQTRYRFIYRIQHADTTRLQSTVSSFFANRIEASPDVESTDKMQLTWQAAEDLLLVHATYDDYADLMEVIRRLDTPQQQVLLQVVIAEVALTDDLEFGVEYFLDAINESGFGTVELAATPGGVASPTGSAFFVGASGLALIQALDAESSVNVLSQPRVTAIDGTESTFQVGGEVPVVATSQNSGTQVDGDTTLIQEIERVPTGVILTIQPRINESGNVRLTTNLEVRSVGADTPLGPTFDERILTTEVLVPHGRTLVLAGFIDDDTSESTSKTPLLGDVPGFGAAFNQIDNSKLRRELLLTITPTVINNPNQANRTVDDFLASATRVRDILSRDAADLPQGLLRRQNLIEDRPAVTLILPEQPAPPTTNQPDPTQPDPAPPEPTPQTQPAPSDPADNLPPNTPDFIREMLRNARDSAHAKPSPLQSLPLVNQQLATALNPAASASFIDRFAERPASNHTQSLSLVGPLTAQLFASTNP